MTAELFMPSVASTAVSIRAVVFDLDGLMVDSESLFFRTAVQLLGRRGKHFTHDLMCRMLGLRGPEGIEVMKREHALDESCESLAAEAREIFYELMPTELRTMPGLATLLDCVEQAGLPKAVATSSTRAYTERVLDQFALRPRFEFLLTAADVTHGKPDPEIYRLAASRHRVAPAEVLVLEDSPVGLAAAKAAGAFCVVIPSAYTPHADWSAADVIADRLDAADLLRLIAPANR
jgi:HAD superfamily hydrolase (TIGR01509 family)